MKPYMERKENRLLFHCICYKKEKGVCKKMIQDCLFCV